LDSGHHSEMIRSTSIHKEQGAPLGNLIYLLDSDSQFWT